MLDRLPHVCPVCAYHEWNLDGLVEMAWEYLDLIRVYTKPKARICTNHTGCSGLLKRLCNHYIDRGYHACLWLLCRLNLMFHNALHTSHADAIWRRAGSSAGLQRSSGH